VLVIPLWIENWIKLLSINRELEGIMELIVQIITEMGEKSMGKVVAGVIIERGDPRLD